MTHHPSTAKHQSSDEHRSGAGDHQQEVTIYQPVQKTVEVPQELIEMTTLRVTNQNETTEQLNTAATECKDSAPREEKRGEKFTDDDAEKMIK